MTHLLGDWVGSTLIWDVPLSCLGSTTAAVQPNGLWDIPKLRQPNPGPRGDGSPCSPIRCLSEIPLAFDVAADARLVRGPVAAVGEP